MLLLLLVVLLLVRGMRMHLGQDMRLPGLAHRGLSVWAWGTVAVAWEGRLAEGTAALAVEGAAVAVKGSLCHLVLPAEQQVRLQDPYCVQSSLDVLFG